MNRITWQGILITILLGVILLSITTEDNCSEDNKVEQLQEEVLLLRKTLEEQNERLLKEILLKPSESIKEIKALKSDLKLCREILNHE